MWKSGTKRKISPAIAESTTEIKVKEKHLEEVRDSTVEQVGVLPFDRRKSITNVDNHFA
jgi:hypothetical protein